MQSVKCYHIQGSCCQTPVRIVYSNEQVSSCLIPVPKDICVRPPDYVTYFSDSNEWKTLSL